MLDEAGQYKVTETWEGIFKESLDSHPEITIFHETGNIGQEQGFDCGPAVLLSAIIPSGYKEKDGEKLLAELTKEATRILKKGNLNIEETGVPPEVMKGLLDRRNIAYVEKPSDPLYPNSAELKGPFETWPEYVQQSFVWLQDALKSGSVCVLAIQTTPEYLIINEATGETAPESGFIDADEETIEIRDNSGTISLPKGYSVVHVVSNEWINKAKAGEESPEQEAIIELTAEEIQPKGYMAATTKGSVDYNGHYILVVGMLEHNDRKLFIVVDPTYKWYQWHREENGIDREKSGYRFVEDRMLMRNWHDRSALGESFNQYAIAIPARES